MAKSEKTGKRPWAKWFGGDWRKDARVRRVGYAARGLWIDMICLMQTETDRFGFLIMDGKPMTTEDLVELLGGAPREVSALTQKLDAGKVFSRVGDPDLDPEISALIPDGMPAGTILCRRMVKDKAKEQVDTENGSKGGKPSHRAGGNAGGQPRKPTLPPTPRVDPRADPQSQSQSQKEDSPPPPSLSPPREPAGGGAGGDAPPDPKTLARRAEEVRRRLLTIVGTDENRHRAWAKLSAISGWLEFGCDPDLDIFPTAIAEVARRQQRGELDPIGSPDYLGDAVKRAKLDRAKAATDAPKPAPAPRLQPRQGNVAEYNPDQTEQRWRDRVDRFCRGGNWLDDQWGPVPTAKGTHVPAGVLAEFADRLPKAGAPA